MARLAAVAWLLSACTDSSAEPSSADAGTEALSLDELMDPTRCASCHPGQFAEWAGSMHAYAATDPVFLAMNRRGQEETDGELGTFCVNCHAPVAVSEGLTQDGLNLEELEPKYQGVTCYFCHSVESIDGNHNNPIGLAEDAILRGPFRDGARTAAHEMKYATQLDSAHQDSSKLCGACHDVTLPASLVGEELALERTFAEWKTTIFAKPAEEGGLSCGGCHMPVAAYREQSARIEGAPPRRSRRHDFEGVDLALTDFPARRRQRVLVEQMLSSSLLAEICVSARGQIEVTLENVGSGHHWPSGASHDREAWLELKAYADGSDPVFETLAPEADGPEERKALIKDHAVKSNGEPAHMFWDVAQIADSTTIPGVITRDPLDPDFHAERRQWLFDSEQSGLDTIQRVTLTVRMRPIALAVLEDLVESGHLDADLMAEMPVIDLLPERCYDAETRADLAGLLPPQECDDHPDRAFTLIWDQADAVADNRNFRESRLDGAPAKCLAHPTYVAVPKTD